MRLPKFFTKFLFNWLVKASKNKQTFRIGSEESPYLIRYFMIPRNRFFNIYLHCFHRGDDDVNFHDHPWYSFSICLNGEYKEVDNRGIRSYSEGHVRFRSAKYAHQIQVENKCWTLFMTGPLIRQWGFHCPKGWVFWRDYVDETGERKGKGGD